MSFKYEETNVFENILALGQCSSLTDVFVIALSLAFLLKAYKARRMKSSSFSKNLSRGFW